MSDPPRLMRRVAFAVMCVVWAGIVILGGRTLWTYENASGVPARAPFLWPRDSVLRRANDRFTLVMLAHPECPCTRASLAQLDRLMARLEGELDVSVLFFMPGSEVSGVESSALWKKAAGIPGVSVYYDRSGAEVRRFGATVSGQVLIYDRGGRLAFSGGITPARGRQGDSPGEDAISQIVTSPQRSGPARRTAPVFGCSLHDPSADELRKDPSWKTR